MEAKVGKILISSEVLKKRIHELGMQITKDYQNKELVLVGVLKGAFLFLSDLSREIDLPMRFDFMAVQSYGAETKTSGVIKILKDLDYDIHNQHVLLVEDIIDTGLTLKYLLQYLTSRKPASLKTCTLLDKPSRRKVEISSDYNGFAIPDEFVVGYGLDFNQYFRELPYIAVLGDENK